MHSQDGACPSQGSWERRSLKRGSQQPRTRSHWVSTPRATAQSGRTPCGGQRSLGIRFAFFLPCFLFLSSVPDSSFLAYKISRVRTPAAVGPRGQEACTHHGDTDGILVLLREDAHQGRGQEQQNQGVLKLKRESREAGSFLASHSLGCVPVTQGFSETLPLPVQDTGLPGVSQHCPRQDAGAGPASGRWTPLACRISMAPGDDLSPRWEANPSPAGPPDPSCRATPACSCNCPWGSCEVPPENRP